MTVRTTVRGAVLLVLLGIVACCVTGDSTPFTEDDCSTDEAIRYDKNIVVDGLQINEFIEHVFDLGGAMHPRPRTKV